jgi:hypothetical protein
MLVADCEFTENQRREIPNSTTINFHFPLFFSNVLFLTLTFSLDSLAVGPALSRIPQHSQTILGVKRKHSHVLQYFPPAM